ncbi:MAG: MotA/TolQ/ExbB proton channel family protein, partial [Euryhalocaulis sp.]|nr:MotA/TolQ/ExbB proton channel family protein [Euryhalocaulis sp.]
MKKMNFTRTLVMAAASFGLIATGAAAAQPDREPASSLSELLNRVQQDSREASQSFQQREQEFQQARSQQQALLNQARSELSTLQGQASSLQAQFDANQARIDELDVQLREAQGEFGELFGVARQTAGEFAAAVRSSAISAQYPGRHRVLDRLANSTTLPTREELDALWKTMLREMIEQGNTVVFNRTVANLDDSGEAPVYRVGPFVLFTTQGGAQFLKYDGSNNLLSVLERQPSGRT